MTMKNIADQKICPRCGAPKMKSWNDLTDEQKFFIERLPMNTQFTHKERKEHRFCERCWFENAATEIRFV
ncbi:MAG TPA: hypothetical protein VF692_08360 [Pyrinomonadaceae bacterium]|jgi:hypothetical protein